jgi:hypothetical protein
MKMSEGAHDAFGQFWVSSYAGANFLSGEFELHTRRGILCHDTNNRV